MNIDQFEALKHEFKSNLAGARDFDFGVMNYYGISFYIKLVDDYQDAYMKCYIAKNLRHIMFKDEPGCNKVYQKGNMIYFQKSNPYHIKLSIKRLYKLLRDITNA